ncbi:MAG TPA: tol-pal system protein YbgF [Polyangia bacterium]|jgi:tol-pal system protein YbgF
MRARVPFAVLALALGGLVACARTAEERQLDSMRADIDNIRDDRDRADQAGLGGEGPPASAAGAAGQQPPPVAPAVQVGAEGEDGDDYADPDDGTPRPRIRVFGSPRVNGAQVEQVDDGTAEPSTTSGRATALDPQAKRAYDAAIALVNAKKYDQALDSLAAFLVKWPDHPYADHAMYWRGECYFARGDYARAADQFEGVVARFPAGAKVPDALLKLGMSQQRLGNQPRAREAYARLAKDFPQTDAARHIPPDTQP